MTSAEISEAFRIDSSDLYFCLFLTLKLTGVIDWSWWWITAPLWVATAVRFVMRAAP